jgi:SAM-dependent methyltransferase
MPTLVTSGMADSSGYRAYHVERCHRNYTLVPLIVAFSAHEREWQRMGETDPWWSVLTSVKKGTGITEEMKASFYKSGREHTARVAKDLDVTGPASRPRFEPKSVLDFGCGLGRLAFSFASRWKSVERVACVDQSAAHLRVAEHEWAARRRPSVTTRLEFVRSNPDLLGALRGQTLVTGPALSPGHAHASALPAYGARIGVLISGAPSSLLRPHPIAGTTSSTLSLSSNIWCRRCRWPTLSSCVMR